MELVSVHRIVMPQKGSQKAKVIEPRERFSADSEQAKSLLASGAARDPNAKPQETVAHAPATRVHPHGKPEGKKDGDKPEKDSKKD